MVRAILKRVLFSAAAWRKRQDIRNGLLGAYRRRLSSFLPSHNGSHSTLFQTSYLFTGSMGEKPGSPPYKVVER